MRIFIEETFYFLTLLIVILFGLEFAWPGSVLSLFNLNYLLLIWLGNAIMVLGTSTPTPLKNFSK